MVDDPRAKSGQSQWLICNFGLRKNDQSLINAKLMDNFGQSCCVFKTGQPCLMPKPQGTSDKLGWIVGYGFVGGPRWDANHHSGLAFWMISVETAHGLSLGKSYIRPSLDCKNPSCHRPQGLVEVPSGHPPDFHASPGRKPESIHNVRKHVPARRCKTYCIDFLIKFMSEYV